ncbi:hypothetical protein G6F62_008209 [Rhizopus arrhizus]|nr:hypothetical protein G6F23_007481 [Rhizopus arrhizus]KAG1328357.1 hypothetical protein G6F62_008209 [Rhizopus arrhizus]
MLKKHDRWTGRKLRQTYLENLRPLDNQRFDVPLVYISALQDLCRNQGKPSKAQKSDKGNSAEKTTYWIHPDNITEVKSILMLHLPVLHAAKTFQPSDAAVSSIYLDNSNFDLYTGLLQKDEMAETIQLDWRGTSNETSVKKEVYHANEQGGTFAKNEFSIDQSQVTGFLSSQSTADQLTFEKNKASLATANDIQGTIQQKKLEPILRIFYHRTAFRLSEAQHIHLDTDLAFIREDHLDGKKRREENDWRRAEVGIDYPFHYVTPEDILRFPYGILETELRSAAPAWLTSLVESHLVHEVPRFNRYLHGVSHFYRVALVPWWLSELETDIRKPRTENFGLTRSRSFKPLIDGQYKRLATPKQSEKKKKPVVTVKGEEYAMVDMEQLNHSKSVTQPLLPQDKSASNNSSTANLKGAVQFYENKEVTDSKGNLISSKKISDPPVDLESGKPVKKLKVDPKTFFSNERTFISWLQFCALLLTVALNLLNFGDTTSRIVGGVFIGVSASVAIYALYRFEKRAWMISHRSLGRYDDLWGPAVLCVVLVVALIMRDLDGISNEYPSEHSNHSQRAFHPEICNDAQGDAVKTGRLKYAFSYLKPFILLITVSACLLGCIYRPFHVQEIFCSLSFIPQDLCESFVLPDFSRLVQTQAFFLDRMTQSKVCLELKWFELATRELHATLKTRDGWLHSDLLKSKLQQYSGRVRQVEHALRSVHAQTQAVMDRLMARSAYLLQSKVTLKKGSNQQALGALYEHTMLLVEDELRRLILAIERTRALIFLLEEDLYAIHEIIFQEKKHQLSVKPNKVMHRLMTIAGSNTPCLIQDTVDLLTMFDAERRKGCEKLLLLLDKLESFQMDLVELRSLVMSPIFVPDAIPLEIHIESIRKTIERLKK